MLLQHLHNCRQGHNARLTPQYVAVFEKDQCGNSLYSKLAGNRGVFVNIYFQDHNLFAKLVLSLPECWRQYLTGSAPFCKKIHQNRFPRTDDLIESCHGLRLYKTVSRGMIF